MTNEKSYKALYKALTQRKKSAVAIVNTDTVSMQAEIKAKIQELLPEYKFYDLDLTGKQFTSITALLKAELPDEIKQAKDIEYVVNITGLQDFAVELRDNEIAPSKVIRQMNFERENIFRSFPALLVFYLDNYTTRKLQETAPDFWDWALNYYFEFTTPESEKFSETYQGDDDYRPEPHYSPERLEKIKELDNKLKTLDTGQPEKRFYKNKINLQTELAEEYAHVREFDKAVFLLNKTLALYENLNPVLGLPDLHKSYILLSMGNNFLDMRKFQTALKYYKWSIDWNKKSNNESEMGGTYHNIGMVYQEQRKWRKALENYRLAIDWKKKNNNASEIGGSYHQIGIVYAEKRQWNKALGNYQKAIDWNKKTNNVSKMGNTYHQIGMVYQELKQWPKAQENFRFAIEWKERTNNQSELGSTYNQVGIIYAEQKQWDKALKNFCKAIDWNKKTNNESKIGSTYHNIGLIYVERTRWNFAHRYFQKAIDWNEKTNNQIESGISYGQMGLYFEVQNQWNKATDYYIRALENMLEYNVQEYRQLVAESLIKTLKSCSDTELQKKAEAVLAKTEASDS